MFRTALRTVAPRALPRVQAPVARSLLTSAVRLSEHQEPIIQGEGGKAGEVPTDLQQATGLERFELLHKMQGEEAFSMEPLDASRYGTLKEPVMVFSLDHERIVGCTGIPADSHDTIHIVVPDSKPVRCPECGCAYQVDYQGATDSHDHHH